MLPATETNYLIINILAGNNYHHFSKILIKNIVRTHVWSVIRFTIDLIADSLFVNIF